MTCRNLFALAAALLLTIAANSTVLAGEAVFYSNARPAGFTTAPLYKNPTSTFEWADDLPFSGSHRVSSFKMGYKSPEPVRATFRFYGVNQETGRPGSLIAEIVRDLPAG